MDPEYTRIAARGESLQQRVAAGHTGDLSDPSALSDETRDVLESFGGVGADGTWAGRHLSGEEVAAHVAFEEWPADEPLPEWVRELQTILESLEPTDRSVPSWADGAPFAEVLLEYVDYAWASFAATYPTDRLTDDGEQSLKIVLLSRLVDALAQAHHVDFVRFVAEREPDLIREDRLSPTSTEWHDRYVDAICRDRAGSFFEEYAVAGRLLVDTIRQWDESLGQFCERLVADADEIAGLVSGDADRVASVSAVGDRHSGNECVMLVEFADGSEVLYKPRTLVPERELYAFERDLTAAFEAVPSLATPDLVERPEYGWVEKVVQRSHDSLDSVADYYERAGALLAITYVLHTTDCHCGNVIAARESPVVVDPETAFEMAGRAATGTDADVRQAVRTRVIEWSVLGTGLLPHDAVPEDGAGFTGVSERQPGADTLQWTNVGTDAVDIEYVPAVADARNNFPIYEGDPVPPAQFETELVDGFERTYRAIQRADERLSTSLVERFDGVETRIILRATQAYDALQNAIRSPTNLRHGARHDLEIRRTLSMRTDDPVLNRETKFAALAPERWDSVIEAEHRAIRRGDVPKFAAYTDDPGLFFDGERVLTELTELTGVDRLRRRLDRLGPDHRRRQVGLVRAALSSPDVVAYPHPDGDV